MNFFDRQDKARRATRWLVVVYIVATILIVAGVTGVFAAFFAIVSNDGRTLPPSTLVGIAVLAILFIIGATLYKTARLSSGGGRVAQDLGGTLISPDVQDPLRRRLRNVVEEMAIASGVPVPEIYVLEEEHGINAFAAGFTPGDAAVAVTRGCLEVLDRDELQGVIAHEFSHILNGDMRLNIRMMGVLFGIMVLGIIGRFILRANMHRSMISSSRDRSAPVVMLLGLGLALLGWIGLFLARLIKAAVSRQREFLADASAVQFMRQTDGIANALKKIGGYSSHSYLKNADPEEVSHMLFAGGSSRLTSLFATHPPLIERIQALDPQFTEENFPKIDMRAQGMPREADQASGFASADVVAPATRGNHSIGQAVVDAVGRPQAQHVMFAQALRSSIPETLYHAAHSPELAWLLVLALAISDEQTLAEHQFALLNDKIGAQRGDLLREFYQLITDIGAAYRLPLLEISFPVIKNRPEQQIEFLIDLVRELISIDGHIDLSEYCFYQILKNHLIQSINPSRQGRRNRVPKGDAQRSAVGLIRLIATHGNDDPEAQRAAFNAGVTPFGEWAKKYLNDAPADDPVAELDGHLEVLSQLNSAGQQSMLKAASEAIMNDGKFTVREAELLRAICATLQCPLPPIIEKTGISID